MSEHNMKVLKICIGTWINASRDKRELSVVKDLGGEVEVLAKGETSGTIDMVDGFKVVRFSTRPLGNRVPTAVNRIFSVLIWASYVRKRTDIDVISGHDYLALTIGWLSNIGKRHKAKLVYDSHEFELGLKKRGKFREWVIRHWERFLIKHSVLTIVVTDTIANEMQRIHGLKERPTVVRNIPDYWQLDVVRISCVRETLCRQLNVPVNSFLIMYHGWLLRNRGIEQLVYAMKRLTDCVGIILGDAHEKPYEDYLRSLVKEQGIADRVLFHPAVSMRELPNYVGAVDVGVSLLQPTVPNHIVALPNKLFENIQGLTPVVVSDFQTIGSLVDQYRIGSRVDPTSPEKIADAIRKLKENKDFYNMCNNNLKRAKEELCWENEKKVLLEAYRRILG